MNTEKELQDAIEAYLVQNKIPYQRELQLSEADRPDFMIDSIAVEVKIQGSKGQIFRQIERYTKHESVTGLLLITNKAMGLPYVVNGVECKILRVGMAWL